MNKGVFILSEEHVKFQFVSGETKGMIEGYSNMTFWNHDLKLKAVLALLDSVDSKDFFDSPNYNELDDYTKEIIKAIEYSLGFCGLYQLVYGDTK